MGAGLLVMLPVLQAVEPLLVDGADGLSGGVKEEGPAARAMLDVDGELGLEVT